MPCNERYGDYVRFTPEGKEELKAILIELLPNLTQQVIEVNRTIDGRLDLSKIEFIVKACADGNGFTFGWKCETR